MLALIAAGRDGGDSGPPVFFTVPWSPFIAERGQLPGDLFHAVREFVDKALPSHGKDRETRRQFLHISNGALILACMQAGWPLIAALGMTVARQITLDLQLLDSSPG